MFVICAYSTLQMSLSGCLRGCLASDGCDSFGGLVQATVPARASHSLEIQQVVIFGY